MPRRWTFFLMALALLGLGGLLSLPWLHRQAPRPVLILLAGAPDPSGPMAPLEIRMLEQLLEDHLESTGVATVLRRGALPQREGWNPPREGWLLRLQPRREGDQLALSFELQRTEPFLKGFSPARVSAPLLPTAEAFRDLLRQLPFTVPLDVEGTLIPRTSESFRYAMELYRRGRSGENLPDVIQALRRETEEDARCAYWPSLGGLLLGLQASHGLEQSRAVVEASIHLFTEALKRRPHLPRAVSVLTMIQVERGALPEAMTILDEARRARPASVRILTGLTYATRYAGLLDLSLRADAAAQNLSLNMPPGPHLALHALYAGQHEAYARSLYLGLDANLHPAVRFNQGYLSLLKGDPEGARGHFREALAYPQVSPSDRLLSQGFLDLLENRKPAAEKAFEELLALRQNSARPDGEYTMRVAEAYALMGVPSRSVDLARVAFNQGFNATTWFETCPLLASMRTHPKWPALHQHLKERQRVMEARFSRSRWGL